MKVTRLELPDVLLVEPAVHHDERGWFLETWSRARYAQAGIPELFVQDNLSRSVRGVVRGLHLQHPDGQGKLVSVAHGEVFDVAVDVRVGSPSFGRWVGRTLTAARGEQLYLPPGFAHGFCATSDEAVLAYKCTAEYAPGSEVSVLWSDPDLAIPWPAADPIVSPKDRAQPRLRDIPPERLPAYEATGGTR